MKDKTLAAKLGLVCATLIWGASFVVVKSTVEEIPPHYLMAYRFSIACVFLCLVFFKRLKSLNIQYAKKGAALGILLFCAYSLQTIGLTMTTPGKNAFLTSAYSVIVPFTTWIFERERPLAKHFIAAAVCVSGVGFVTIDAGLTVNKGDLLTLACSIAYAVHMQMVYQFTRSGESDAILYTIIQFAATALASWIVAAVFEKAPGAVSSHAALGIIFLAIPASAVALALQTAGQKHLKAETASIILSLEAVFGVLFSMVLYAEKLTAQIIFGFFLIFSSLLVSELQYGKQKKKAGAS
ncbi:MAG: DMT family transporter [Eubacteriaceae bacterium]|nr:DMT family transporter [Eubacteriaceae bacterium]